jgi:ankyrin repeat protein
MQERMPSKEKAQAEKPTSKTDIASSEENAPSQWKQKRLNVMLLKAAEHGKTRRAGRLLRLGANIEAEYSSGDTALIMAVEQGHTDTVRLLANKGANVNAKDIADWTALMQAAKIGQTGICAILIEKGADSEAKSLSGTAFMIAESWNKDITAAFLKSMEAFQDWMGKETFRSFLSAFNECASH